MVKIFYYYRHDNDLIVELKTLLQDWQKTSPTALGTLIVGVEVKKEIIEDIDEIFSETTQAERIFLYHFFSKVWSGSGSVVEIGPFLGGTTRAIAYGMIDNPAAEKPVLVTADQFDGYHRGAALLEKARNLIENYSVEPDIVVEIKKGRWLELFKKVHMSKKYGHILRVVECFLPNRANEPFPSELLESYDSIDHISVLFVDGCKSRFSTKSLMMHSVEKLEIGSFVIFQDYGRYTRFWITAFCEAFEQHFKLIANISGIYAFEYVNSLSPEEIDKRFPDSPKGWDKDQFELLYRTSLRKAFTRGDPRALAINTLHPAAAYAYPGHKDQAREIILPTLNHPGMELMKELAESGLKAPTFSPDGPVALD